VPDRAHGGVVEVDAQAGQGDADVVRTGAGWPLRDRVGDQPAEATLEVEGRVEVLGTRLT